MMLCGLVDAVSHEIGREIGVLLERIVLKFQFLPQKLQKGIVFWLRLRKNIHDTCQKQCAA